MIYAHVFPSQQIIHVDSASRTTRRRQLYFGQCSVHSTEKDGEQEFRSSTNNQKPSYPGMLDRHAHCWTDLSGGPARQSLNPRQRVKVRVDTALFLTCRQIYHEAKYMLYATNMYSFRSPITLRSFMRGVERGASARNPTVRKIHLSIGIHSRADEYSWNQTLRLMVQRFPGLDNVCVSTYQQFSRYRYSNAPFVCERPFTDPATGKNLFLRGVLELRKLPLTRLVVIFLERGMSVEQTPTRWGTWRVPADEIPTRWTKAQRVEWASFVKATILGSN